MPRSRLPSMTRHQVVEARAADARDDHAARASPCWAVASRRQCRRVPASATHRMARSKRGDSHSRVAPSPRRYGTCPRRQRARRPARLARARTPLHPAGGHDLRAFEAAIVQQQFRDAQPIDGARAHAGVRPLRRCRIERLPDVARQELRIAATARRGNGAGELRGIDRFRRRQRQAILRNGDAGGQQQQRIGHAAPVDQRIQHRSPHTARSPSGHGARSAMHRRAPCAAQACAACSGAARSLPRQHPRAAIRRVAAADWHCRAMAGVCSPMPTVDMPRRPATPARPRRQRAGHDSSHSAPRSARRAAHGPAVADTAGAQLQLVRHPTGPVVQVVSGDHDGSFHGRSLSTSARNRVRVGASRPV